MSEKVTLDPHELAFCCITILCTFLGSQSSEVNSLFTFPLKVTIFFFSFLSKLEYCKEQSLNRLAGHSGCMFRTK